MAEDEKTFTQADVNRIVSDRLREERTRRGDNEALMAENTALKASLLSEQTTRQALEANASLKEDVELRHKIAKEVNLPEGLIPLITGKTEDEIRSNMKIMVSSIGPGPAIGAVTNPAIPAPVRYTRSQVDSMKPEDITKNWPTIEAQLADGSLR